jgi:DNA ligase-1
VRRFCALFDALDRASGTTERVHLLAEHLREAPAADAAWTVHCLLGGQRRRLITARRLRQICREGSGLPEWLFEDCQAHVGDSAEVIALLWPRRAGGAGAAAGEAALAPLHVWMERILPGLAALEAEAQAEAVGRLWDTLAPGEIFVMNKLLSGGFRVGVGRGLVLRALARLSGIEEPVLAHRLMGGFTPSAQAYAALIAPGDSAAVPISRPYPFFLASPLESSSLEGGAGEWLAEWKWDGIRAQLIRRRGEGFLWSRGEELLNGAFPDLVERSASLPDGTVLDGEVLVWREGAAMPESFALLQRRLGRRSPPAAVLRDCPAAFVAYDLLESGGCDRREQPLRERRRELERLLRDRPLRLSPDLGLADWSALEPLRSQARQAGAEGVMLKHRDSPYLAGRRRGHWWKHKLEPYRLDAVLLYAQAGRGRRANLFTDYTFGLRSADGDLVTFARAYSGLDDGEIEELDRWIRRHTVDRYGPVRAVEPQQVFELAFEGLQPSRRHRSGIAVRFPRISRWRRDKPAAEADDLAAAHRLMRGEAG